MDLPEVKCHPCSKISPYIPCDGCVLSRFFISPDIATALTNHFEGLPNFRAAVEANEEEEMYQFIIDTFAAVGISQPGALSITVPTVPLSFIVSDPFLGNSEPAIYDVEATICEIKAGSVAFFMKCKKCNKNDVNRVGGTFWCNRCEAISEDDISVRCSLSFEASDKETIATFTSFGEHVKAILGYSVDELLHASALDGDESLPSKLEGTTGVKFSFRVEVTPLVSGDNVTQLLKIIMATQVVAVAELAAASEAISDSADVLEVAASPAAAISDPADVLEVAASPAAAISDSVALLESAASPAALAAADILKDIPYAPPQYASSQTMAAASIVRGFAELDPDPEVASAKL